MTNGAGPPTPLLSDANHFPIFNFLPHGFSCSGGAADCLSSRPNLPIRRRGAYLFGRAAWESVRKVVT
jgi:hypothetical protein